ncbi:MAG: glutathione peroxidase [Candidatus Competibacteraceae bacterium]|jgi:glutathione peroxidase|nr:glutathione peroxidase [Candidatus Competibacteraceae bacterium]
MRYLISLSLFLILPFQIAVAASCPATLDFNFRSLAGEEQVSLCDSYAGKVLLVVNTASKCGFTPQYDGLESLYKKYKDQGFVVLGFPSNDFAQEPGTEQEIQSFCRLTYGVEFPMFEKITVKGDGAHPFYQTLAAAETGYPSWNFYKYLLDRDGNVVELYPSSTGPDDGDLIEAIEQLL